MSISFFRIIVIAFQLLPTATIQDGNPSPTPAITEIVKLDAPHAVAYAIKERPLNGIKRTVP